MARQDIPLARLKFRDVASLRALPAPALKLQKRVLLGTSGFCLRLAYECPLDSLARFFAPPARFMAHLDNAVDSGVRVTQSGLEFAANLRCGGGQVEHTSAYVSIHHTHIHASDNLRGGEP